jgi:hypothetical protein
MSGGNKGEGISDFSKNFFFWIFSGARDLEWLGFFSNTPPSGFGVGTNIFSGSFLHA